MTLAEGPLVAFYGDDFTGSAAVLELLASAGLATVLFFREPDAAMLERIGPVRAVGLAGLARAQTPDWMDRNLPGAFEFLKATGAPLVHYKICSTFDSSPGTGSIGRAIEIGRNVLPGGWTPVVTAAPEIGRWQAFGTLFASVGDEVHRIDRHPVMKRHPVTPMHEADLRRHLSAQTGLGVGLIDLVDLKNRVALAKAARETARGAQVLLIDVVDNQTLAETGRLLWDGRRERPFVVGSQGIEYALVAFWRNSGMLPETAGLAPSSRCDRIAVVSGSCSPTTAQQIARAGAAGFTTIAANAALATDPRAWEGEVERCATLAIEMIASGTDPLVHTSLGPDDPLAGRLGAAIAAGGHDRGEVGHRIGSGLGRILDRIVAQTGIRRVAVAGGDSSGQACLAMSLTAVTALSRIEPSAPLCRVYSDAAHLDGIEIALKGGQMGSPDYFEKVRGTR